MSSSPPLPRHAHGPPQCLAAGKGSPGHGVVGTSDSGKRKRRKRTSPAIPRSEPLLPRPGRVETVDLRNPLPRSNPGLANLANIVARCSRCVAVIGAGVSVSSGLPDFRSPDGLFQLLSRKYPRSIVSGRDLFDASLFRDETSAKLFFNFVGEFKELVDNASCTPTHLFLRKLDERGQLLRCYSQNIDCLEEQAGLATSFRDKISTTKEPEGENTKGPRLLAEQRKRATRRSAPESPRAVQLHGNLAKVVCTRCRTRRDFDATVISAFKSGLAPECADCCEHESARSAAGLRPKGVGIMRPDVVLYNEFHPFGERIGDISTADIRNRPDLLLVMGTSLKVPGVRRLIKEMSRAVRATQRGRTVLVNREPPADLGCWASVFDYLVLGDADAAVDAFEGKLDGLLRAPAEVPRGEEKGEDDDDFQTSRARPHVRMKSHLGGLARVVLEGGAEKFGANPQAVSPPPLPSGHGAEVPTCPGDPTPAQKTITGTFKARKKRKSSDG